MSVQGFAKFVREKHPYSAVILPTLFACLLSGKLFGMAKNVAYSCGMKNLQTTLGCLGQLSPDSFFRCLRLLDFTNSL